MLAGSSLIAPWFGVGQFQQYQTADSMTVYIIPVVSGLGGALILDEYVTTGMIGGMGLIAAGIACLNQPRKRVPLTPGRPMTGVVGGRGPTPG